MSNMSRIEIEARLFLFTILGEIPHLLRWVPLCPTAGPPAIASSHDFYSITHRNYPLGQDSGAQVRAR